jgi:hypothetical protein
MRASPRRHLPFLVAFVVVVAVTISIWSRGGREVGPPVVEPSRGAASGSVATRHPRIVNPAGLDGPRAEAVYRAILGQLLDVYSVAGDPVTEAYSSWQRYNRYPYRSADHGDRFVNNYANDIARAYGRFEQAGPMPEGSIVVKDSFVVTRDGDIEVGPFALMEKMSPGSDPTTGDWLYMMIDPRGNVVGISRGPQGDKMRFCNECHAKAPVGNDRLYFMPKDARLPIGQGDRSSLGAPLERQ